MRLKLTLALLLAISALPAAGQALPAPAPPAAAPEAPARFIACAWFPVDVKARRLASATDTGVLVRFWTARSTIRDGENVFGPIVGLRTLGFGWIWRFKDSSFYAGAGGVVETARLFDRQKRLQAMPAVMLGYRFPKGGSG